MTKSHLGTWLSLCLCLGLSLPLSANQRAQTEVAQEDHDEGSALAPTRVLSNTDVERLQTEQGLTLQWIGWGERGELSIRVSEEGHWFMSGKQDGGEQGVLTVDGFIPEIGPDYFTFDGRIEITDAPTLGRMCSEHKLWRFEATRRRSYYRLREFEWCDRLTDYVDIYFAPGLR